MILNALIQLVRFHLDEFGTTWLRDSDPSRYSITNALQEAYKDYAIQVKPFISSFTATATANVSEYAFTAFGTGANALFEPTAVAFNSVMLVPELETQLAGNWRFDAASTPYNYVKWGTRKIKLYPTPSASGSIYLEGFVTPETTTLAASGDTPDIPESDHKLLALKAAMQVIVRNPSDINMAKYQPLADEYQAGIQNAILRRTGETSATDVVVGSKPQPTSHLGLEI
jgi:hypothetical protein